MCGHKEANELCPCNLVAHERARFVEVERRLIVRLYIAVGVAAVGIIPTESGDQLLARPVVEQCPLIIGIVKLPGWRLTLATVCLNASKHSTKPSEGTRLLGYLSPIMLEQAVQDHSGRRLFLGQVHFCGTTDKGCIVSAPLEKLPDDVLQRLIAEYQAAVDQGNNSEGQRLLQAHPHLAAALRQFAADRDRLPEAVPEFPNGPAFDPTIIQEVSPAPGVVIAGRYKLLENIGQGGMGSVWVAQQTDHLKRKVAVKLIKPGMDSKQVLARFDAERQALALMDHPHIAKVYDGGVTTGGRPFFVMEYVKGIPFTDYCDQARLSLADRLQLFIPVCQAVQHAHQKGIIHRDLKPSNILICLYDGRPVPKVIDFGLAKAMHQSLTDQSIYTQHGMMVGTPLYMSPEQAEYNNLDIDTRSDIYSLGVVLYELLTGSTPLERDQLRKAAHDEILRMIKSIDPLRPSLRLSGSASLPSIAAQRGIEPKALQRTLAGDLDWIVMKSLEKDRNRRYETANGLARDIERYLHEEPIEARPPSMTYQFRKLLKKYRPQAFAAGLVLAALIVGIIGTSWGLRRAHLAEGKAKDSESKALQALADVTKERDAKIQALVAKTAALAEKDEALAAKVKALADEAAARQRAEAAEAQTLASYRESTDDVIQQLIGSKEELSEAERAYLERTAQRWQVFAERQGTDEQSQKLRAEGLNRVAAIWLELGRLVEARKHFEESHALWKQLSQKFPAVPEYRHNLAATGTTLCGVLIDLGETDAARLAIAQAEVVWRHLAEQYPTNTQYQYGLAGCCVNLGVLLNSLKEYAAAIDQLGRARDLSAKLVSQYPLDENYNQQLALAQINLGNACFYSNDISAARTAFEQARDIRKALCEQFPSQPRYQTFLVQAQMSLGMLYVYLKETTAARESYEEAEKICLKLVQQFPAVPDYQDLLANSENGLGSVFDREGDRVAARDKIIQARDIVRNLVDHFPSVPKYRTQLAVFEVNLGRHFVQNGQPAESLDCFSHAIRILSTGYPSGYQDSQRDRFLETSYRCRAQALMLVNRYSEAVEDWDQVILRNGPGLQNGYHLSRAEAQVRAGQVESALKVADETNDLDGSRISAMGRYRVAALYAYASGLPESPPRYADRAIELLKKAIDAGFKTPENITKMISDHDLDPLRGREDFRALMKSIGAPEPNASVDSPARP